MIFRAAATASSVVNLSIDRTFRLNCGTGPVIYREYGPGKRPICAILPRIGLDRLHIGVRQPEMVPDLVDQDVADDIAQGFLVLGPVVEDRASVEPDHVAEAGDGLTSLLPQTE